MTFLIITLLLMYVSHALIWVLMTFASVEFDTTPIRILGIIGAGSLGIGPAFTHAPGVYIALGVFLIAGVVFVRRCESTSLA
ncbi:MAG: hypothetical protein EA383_04410 [Spirochaetaceae bacterium]|nr:MAG: hypothetical protein EA383_04410 [Spirochaetaceae bacterium]